MKVRPGGHRRLPYVKRAGLDATQRWISCPVIRWTRGSRIPLDDSITKNSKEER